MDSIIEHLRIFTSHWDVLYKNLVEIYFALLAATGSKWTSFLFVKGDFDDKTEKKIDFLLIIQGLSIGSLLLLWKILTETPGNLSINRGANHCFLILGISSCIFMLNYQRLHFFALPKAVQIVFRLLPLALILVRLATEM